MDVKAKKPKMSHHYAHEKKSLFTIKLATSGDGLVRGVLFDKLPDEFSEDVKQYLTKNKLQPIKVPNMPKLVFKRVGCPNTVTPPTSV